MQELKENKIPEDIERKALYKFIKSTEVNYFKTFGYVNKETFDHTLMKEILKNYQKDENYQYLFVKKKQEEKFLKKVYCENDAEFYFIFILANNLISRIGKIIHQNDNIFQSLFYDINDNLKLSKYKLIEDKKNNIKFITQKEGIDSLKSLDFKKLDISLINEFTENLANSNISRLKKLLKGDKIKELEEEIKNKFEDLKEFDGFKNDISLLEVKKEQFAFFIFECYELFELFPSLKEDIVNIIANNDTPKLFMKDAIYTGKKENDQFINIFSNMYALTTYLMKTIKYLEDEFQKKSEKYKGLLNKYLNLELIKKIFELFENYINKENNIFDYFEDVKKNTIEMFNNVFAKNNDNSSESNLSKTQFEIFQKEKEAEKNKFKNIIEKMKNITLKELGDKFKNFDDYDINSFADTKLDVILFLCQNNYI